MTAFFTPNELTNAPAVSIGGKATGLLRIVQAGASTPPFRILSVEAVSLRVWNGADALKEIADFFEVMLAEGWAGVAVRSSAVVEDQAENSYAGVFETRLVRNANELRGALDAVADSANAARHDNHPAPMAIVVQALVEPSLAGVLFSAHPTKANPARAYVEIVEGSGSTVVEGSAAPSTASITVADGEVCNFTPGANGPNQFSSETAQSLLQHLLNLEQVFDAPLDIEWATDKNSTVWVLQARPITALRAEPALRPECWATCWFFDQRFTEPIRPITRTSLLPLVADSALRAPLRMRHQEAPEPLLIFCGGQAYVPHEAYRRLLYGTPKFLLRGELEQLFPPHLPSPDHGFFSILHYWATAFAAWFAHWRESIFLLPAWRKFQRELAGYLREFEYASPEIAGDWLAQWQKLDAWTLRFLSLHRWAVLWADYAFRFYRIALSILPKPWSRSLDANLHRALHLKTAEANAALQRYLKHPTDEVRETLLREYGHRSGSLDYAAPTWAELIEMDSLCEAYPFAGDTEDSAPKRGSILGTLLHPLRRLLELREEQRFEWEKILARQRGLLLRAGEFLKQRNEIDLADDIFFVEWSELETALENHHAPDRATIASRKHTHAVEHKIPTPRFIGPEEAPAAPEGNVLQGIGASSGQVEGPAVVLAGASAYDPARHTEAIVVLTALDPAWSPLLAQLRGAVIERGGVLSHAAVLAREYGVPLVIGVDAATEKIHNGDTVAIDGDRGLVTLREGACPHAPVREGEPVRDDI